MARISVARRGVVAVPAEVVLPRWGVSMKEATVVLWHHQAGDAVSAGDPLVDVETDKVDTTIESPCSGVLTQILVQSDETVPVGTLLAVIE